MRKKSHVIDGDKVSVRGWRILILLAVATVMMVVFSLFTGYRILTRSKSRTSYLKKLDLLDSQREKKGGQNSEITSDFDPVQQKPFKYHSGLSVEEKRALAMEYGKLHVDLPEDNNLPALNIVDTDENSEWTNTETQSNLPDLDVAEKIDLPQEPIKQHACSNHDVWEPGVDVKGGDLQPRKKGERYHVKDTGDCCNICQREPKCKAWVYSRPDEVCYLKSAVPKKTKVLKEGQDLVFGTIDEALRKIEVAEDTHKRGAIDRVRATPQDKKTAQAASEPVHPCGILYKNVDFLGGDMPRGELYHIKSHGDCCNACRNTEQCTAWVYSQHNKVCYMKNGLFLEIKNKKAGVTLYSGRIQNRKSKIDEAVTAPPIIKNADTPQEIFNVFPTPAQAAKGKFPDVTDKKILAKSNEICRKRANAIKEAMKFHFGNYHKFAWGFDEMKPRTGRGQNNWGSMAVTLLDSLDTLWVMGLHDEFDAATDWISKNLKFSHVRKMMSVFEIIIRNLGGLLSAYSLSKRKVYLEKAEELANRLLPAFKTPTGLPAAQISLGTGRSAVSWTGSNAVLAEFGTLQLEFRYLTKLTGREEFRRIADTIYDKIPRSSTGLYATHYNRATGRQASRHYTMGALADSFYEYLLKMWLQTGRTEDRWRKMYDFSVIGMRNHLFKRSKPSGLLFIGEKKGVQFKRQMDHLACFTAGMLALGAKTDPRGMDSPRAQQDLEDAKALTYTCYRMYAHTKTGLSPEWVAFNGGFYWDRNDMKAGTTKYYILRPEVVESLFILHRITGHPVYREWGWDIWKAIEKNCRTRFGYGNYANVNRPGMKPDDRAESFFLAETLKYLYLLFLPREESGIDLDKIVFNTEAHPLPIFQW